jgi:putative addiction module component (TIGR02574 family)
MSFEEVRAAALALPADEQRKLGKELRAGTGRRKPFTLTPAQIEELERREAYLREHPESARPWEEVYAELKAKYGG